MIKASRRFAGSGSAIAHALATGASYELRGASDGAGAADGGAGGAAEDHHQETRLALAAFADKGVRVDVVYPDPPYASDLYEPLMLSLESVFPRLLPGSIIVIDDYDPAGGIYPGAKAAVEEFFRSKTLAFQNWDLSYIERFAHQAVYIHGE